VLDIELLPDEVEEGAEAPQKGYQAISPTGVDTWIMCPRRWAFRYIARIKEPFAASAALGTEAHDQLEHFLTKGKPIDFTKASGEILQPGLQYFPQPLTPGLRGERTFRFQSPRTKFVYTGKKDVELPPGIALPNLMVEGKPWFDGSVPIVEDLKTTSSIGDWAKTIAQLEYDAQSVIYAIDSAARYEAKAVDLAWVYCQTKGAKKSEPRRLRMLTSHALRCFDAIERIGEEMANARREASAFADGPRAYIQTMPPNPASCSKFGKEGCPHQAECNLSPSQKVRKGIKGQMGAIEDLKARLNGNATPKTEAPPKDITPPTPPTPELKEKEPNLMGCAAEDVPAPTEVPKWMTEKKPDDPINPPEAGLGLAPLPEKKSAEDAKESKPKRGRPAGSKNKPKPDPLGADAAAATGLDEKKPEEPKGADYTCSDQAAQDAADKAVEKCGGEVKAVREGFTLYVDCMPIGVKVTQASRFIAEAQACILEEEKVDDYRLIDFGKGAPSLVAAFLTCFDGSDLVLNSDTPEGRTLLEPLMGKASLVVRGLR
jgi:hypothetical protein